MEIYRVLIQSEINLVHGPLESDESQNESTITSHCQRVVSEV